MIGKKGTSASGGDKLDTVVGKDTKVEGSVVGKGAIRIDGEVEGELTEHGEIIVGETGNVSSDIQGKEITIAGKVRGNIISNGKVEIYGSGSVVGNIQTANLVIHEGAIFKGACEMAVNSDEKKEKDKKEAADTSSGNKKHQK